ncbi:MAG: 4-hydroxythreonine-4-phosphate dehydrogenase [Salinisphaeraceae bacterium]|nr:4-hydroxythreonine-4-phosphate dehydrogenase [Salinisphaeraceae bacterium]
MSTGEAHKPRIGIVAGDPNGIGPEVTVKAWAAGDIKQHCRPVVVGSASVIERALEITGVPLSVRAVRDTQSISDEANVVDVLGSSAFDAADIRFGDDHEDAGVASGGWLDHAHTLACDGELDGTVMGPISTHSLKMAGKLERISTLRDGAYLVLRSGPLVIAHLTDHVPLAEVTRHITTDSVYALIDRLNRAMRQWGVGSGRIGVAGFNPHAEGTEEDNAISPAVQKARQQGLSIDGPIGPDSIFRHCIEGRHDAVIAMYHDQGHIALKTWGFSGNSVVFLGPPYIHTTVAHGTAYDLAGSGTADSSMLLHSILDAASLADSRGFVEHKMA